MITRKAIKVVTSKKKIKFLQPLAKQMTQLNIDFYERGADNAESFKKIASEFGGKRFSDLGAKNSGQGPFAEEWAAFVRGG